MKFDLHDLALLRWNLLAIGASLLFSAAFLYGTGEYAGRIAQMKQAAKTRLDGARAQLAAANDDMKNMAAYADEYAQLKAGGIIGDGHRLDWIEGLESLQRRGIVRRFRYEIAPQTAYAPVQPMDGGGFDIRYSGMKLEFDLLHEGQLLDFFTALRTYVRGRYQLEGCTLRRTAESEPGDTWLKAECRGGWITLKSRSDTP